MNMVNTPLLHIFASHSVVTRSFMRRSFPRVDHAPAATRRQKLLQKLGLHALFTNEALCTFWMHFLDCHPLCTR
jgi:hypothetical protein